MNKFNVGDIVIEIKGDNTEKSIAVILGVDSHDYTILYLREDKKTMIAKRYLHKIYQRAT